MYDLILKKLEFKIFSSLNSLQFEYKKLFLTLNQNKNNFSFGGIEINKICF